MKGTTGAGKHEGRAAVRHSKIPEPELNTEDATADGRQTAYTAAGGSRRGREGKQQSIKGAANTRPRGFFQRQAGNHYGQQTRRAAG